MKLLWVKSDFLHPTNRGGQIRTLEILRRLHARHEVHYVAFDRPGEPEGPRRSCEYASRAYPVRGSFYPRTSPMFWAQVGSSVFSPLPMVIARCRSARMRTLIAELNARERFDRIVCDFIHCAPNIPDLENCVLFQHNVETVIWQRHAEQAPDALRRAYMRLQTDRMRRYEREVCRRAGHVVAVSPVDAGYMREHFGCTAVSEVPTGVDTAYFQRPAAPRPVADLVFTGAMDWLPNVDGACFFVQEILPLIRRRIPDCSLALAGRAPTAAIRALAERDPAIHVTGTVDDIRPYLWGASLAIVPLRIGGGTRLKIYESMAAGTAVVSTAVGAEGLAVSSPENIRLADAPEAFAAACIDLLTDAAARQATAEAGLRLVTSRFSWDHVVSRFEEILSSTPGGSHPCGC